MRYRGFLLLAALAACTAGAAELPAPVRIFPTAETLPANHHKFYLHFAEPMRQGVFLDFCALLDANAVPVREPFRETELWSDDRCRLTLWLHPGRQKTGVNLNTDFGPVLEPDRSYTLRISGRWPTARGPALGTDAAKPFRTSAAVTKQLDPAEWRIAPPRAGTKQALEIVFPASLDHALLGRCFRVVDATRTPIAGTIHIPPGEKAWQLAPSVPWSHGQHFVLVESALEDLGGNSLARPFEVDLTAAPPRPTPPVVELPLQIALED